MTRFAAALAAAAILFVPAAAAQPSVPAFRHAVVIVFENKEYASVVGSSQAPTFNRMARAVTGKNDAQSCALFVRQISNALSRDGFGLLGNVGSDQKVTGFRISRFSAHFCFAKKRITQWPRSGRCPLRFAADFLP